MKPHLRSLKPGVQVWGLVEDCIAGDEVVINFSGDLVRVANESSRVFRVGERVQLRVTSLKPLQFQVLNAHSEPLNSLSINVFI